METADSLASKRRLTRSSLACLPCRSRHIKCDGQRPRCTRCVETSKECDYTESRRGGLDRAALAERRRKLTAAETGYPPSPPRSTGLQQDHNGLDLSEDVDIGIEWVSEVTPPLSIDYNIPNPGTLDPLVESYYKNFHKFHPVAPPRKHLIRLCQDMVRANQLNPLIQVLRFIGHIYSYREWSTPLRSSLEASFTQVLDKDPIIVLCRLLYSIPLFWFGYNAEAKQQMDMASALALELGMYQQGFAPHHGSGDPVLAEMWRRTWWLLYVVDCSYAGTLGTRIFAFQHVKHTADLPCEDHEYESGDIPEPRTLEDFDSREFSFEETVFSSFAYLIGAVRCGISAMTSLPKFVTKEDSEQLIQKFDSTADAWLLLLPKSKQVVMTKTGEIDEIMFQAHLILHVATIGLHRPLSDLKFNAVEDISSCAREPPPDTPTSDLVNVHTVRILRAVEAQIRLLALPVRPFHHSPFTTCTVSEGTLALLSACNYLLKGRDLEVARDQIRLQIGCLKALAELWPRTARNVKEIQIIARHVLKLEYKNDGTSSESSNSNQGSSLLRGSTGVCDQDGPPSGNIFANADLMDGACGWYGPGTLGPDGGISNWWMNE